eukprot:scaffold41662_cov59-Phaeocystis_antarctica.AAC.1
MPPVGQQQLLRLPRATPGHKARHELRLHQARPCRRQHLSLPRCLRPVLSPPFPAPSQPCVGHSLDRPLSHLVPAFLLLLLL